MVLRAYSWLSELSNHFWWVSGVTLCTQEILLVRPVGLYGMLRIEHRSVECKGNALFLLYYHSDSYISVLSLVRVQRVILHISTPLSPGNQMARLKYSN